LVTGKGGTGKSTVATAMAMALARRRPTTLGDLDGRGSVARLLGAHESETLDLVTITPRGELEAFIERIVPLRAVSRRMLKSRTFGYVTTALPGLEAFLILERLRLIAGKATLEDRFAVIDAPATGHALELLAVARSIRKLAPTGTLHRLSSAVEEFLTDRNRCGVMLTVTPEELALREAVEAAAALRESDIGCVGAVVNMAPPVLFTAAEIAKLGTVAAHAHLAERRFETSKLAVRARDELARAGIAVSELPTLYEATLGRQEVEQLSRGLERELFDTQTQEAAPINR
jgi:anion-transporting  ArsA/GET3 family ATPase